MNDAIIKALTEEREALKRKLRAVENTLYAYGVLPTETADHYAVQPQPQPKQAKSRAPSETTLAIRDAIRRLIYHRGETPTPTRELLEFVTNQGLEVGGKNPIATLSALLSHSDNFHSIGRSGWVYREDSSEDYPPKENEEAEASSETEGVAAPSKLNLFR